MAMDHAAAHERIADLLLEPARLATLADSGDAIDIALREHLTGCPICRADLASWQQLRERLADALPETSSAMTASAEVEPVELPPSLRAAVITAVRVAGPAHGPLVLARARSRRAVATWVGLAASIVVLTGAGVITVDQVARRAAADAEARDLAKLVAVVDGVLAAEHKVVELRRPDGTAAGSISWSRHDWVVLTSALPRPADDQRYKCWLEDGERSVAVGVMDFAGGTAYWVATLDEWQTWEIGPTTRFVISLEAADAPARTGPIVLSAGLRS
jgi:hypothetical protein